MNSGPFQQPESRQLKESRCAFQVRTTLPAQNAPHYQPLLPKTSCRAAAAKKHRERTIRFAARSDNEIKPVSVVIQRLKIQPTRVSTMLMRMQVASGK